MAGAADQGRMTRTAQLLAVLVVAALLVIGVGRLPSAVAHRADAGDPVARAGQLTAARASRSATLWAGATGASTSSPDSLPVEDGTPQPVIDRGVLPVSGAPFDVEDDEITLVDTTRSTPARGGAAAKPERTLRTVIRRPVGVAGAMPLVVFAHGYNAEPEMYERLLDAWAAAGYLVAAPELPGSARDLPGSPVRSDIAEQATDLSFVIGQLLDGRAGPVDPFHIAAAGHSDGGSTLAVLALDRDHYDARIGAYLVLAGDVPGNVRASWGSGDPNAALFVAVGDQDEYGNLPAAGDVFGRADMPKTMVVARGGDHIGTFVNDSTTGDAMRAVSVRFLDAVLRGDNEDLASRVQHVTLTPADTMLRLTQG
jgi:dienelactone hydrolase